MKKFDVVIIGGGPGATTSGSILASAGKMVALIQNDQESLGGICLNRGCMPTKSLLKTASVYTQANNAAKYGLEMTTRPVDLARLRDITESELDRLRAATANKVNKAGISVYRGMGAFTTAHEITITDSQGNNETIFGEQIIIATGSRPVELPFAHCDGNHILNSDQLLTNTDIPEKLLIIGGGVISCEFATIYNSFGSQVTIVEALDTLLPREDQEAGKTLAQQFEKQGMKIKTSQQVKNIEINDEKVTVSYTHDQQADRVDKVLIAIGRRPHSSHLNLAAAGVNSDREAIIVDQQWRTNIPHIYALGDVTGQIMLAHAAEKQAELLASAILGNSCLPFNATMVPRVTFCHPEVAAIGASATTPEIKAIYLAKVPNGRTIVDKVEPAYIKMFVDEKTEQLKGAIVIGECATEMIHELALQIENGYTLKQIGSMIHAHPTHSKNILQTIHHAS